MWKPEYDVARRERAERDPAYKAKLREQSRPKDPEKRREYMKEYVKRNRARINELRRAKADAWNAIRRERYAKDPVLREKARAATRAAAAANPRKRRDEKLRAAFGIGVDEYDRILASQKGRCAICGAKYADRRRARLAVDHCHETGLIRGLLCSSCNQGIGQFKDDPKRLRNAAAYLERSTATETTTPVSRPTVQKDLFGGFAKTAG